MNHELIEKLKTKSFSALSYAEKRLIISCGKPIPDLDLRKQNKKFVRKINSEIYKKCSWICGSSSTNKLYCWPCLLFSNKDSVWSLPTKGYNDLNNLQTSVG